MCAACRMVNASLRLCVACRTASFAIRRPQQALRACVTRSFAAYGNNIATTWQRGAQQVAARCNMLQHGSTTCCNHATQTNVGAYAARSLDASAASCDWFRSFAFASAAWHACKKQESHWKARYIRLWTVDPPLQRSADKAPFHAGGPVPVQMWASPVADVGQSRRRNERAGREDLDGTSRVSQHALLVAGRDR